jgi:hypothetical protein
LTAFYHQKTLFKESGFRPWRSAFSQRLRSSHKAVCCHLGPREEVGEESNTDSQPAEDEDDLIAQRKKRSSQQAVCFYLGPHEEKAIAGQKIVNALMLYL